MSLLTCHDLCFSYEGRTVLCDVNFTVEEGDYLAVIGENGAGKSTLMKGLLQLKKPTSGELIYGDGLTGKEIGYLPQQTRVQKDFPASVYEVVLSGCLNHLGRHFFYGKKRSLEMRLKSSNSQNNTGFYRVSKKKSPTSVQGYIWVYRWYDNDKRKAITSVDLIKLKEKVVDRGLPWIKLSDME